MNGASVRRACVALLALAVASPLFRPQLSLALVARGDDFLYRAQTARALTYYRRAVVMDPSSPEATDRYAFFLQSLGDTASEEAAVQACDRFLEHGDDPNVRADRGLAGLKLRRYTQAQSDFEAAGATLHDARYLAFAAWTAWHERRGADARRLWSAARRLGYRPAIWTSERHQ